MDQHQPQQLHQQQSTGLRRRRSSRRQQTSHGINANQNPIMTNSLFASTTSSSPLRSRRHELQSMGASANAETDNTRVGYLNHAQQSQSSPSPQQQRQQQQRSNNNSSSNVAQMEQILYNLHYKSCSFLYTYTNIYIRRCIEVTVLVVAVCCFAALVLLHRTFITSASPASAVGSASTDTCFNSIPGFIHASSTMSTTGSYFPLVTHIAILDDESAPEICLTSNCSHVVQIPPLTNATTAINLVKTDRILFSQCFEKSFLLIPAPHSYYYHNIQYEQGQPLNSQQQQQQQSAPSSTIYDHYQRQQQIHLLPIHHQYVYISKYDTNCFGSSSGKRRKEQTERGLSPTTTTTTNNNCIIQKLLQYAPSIIDTIVVHWFFHEYTFDAGYYIYNPRVDEFIHRSQHETSQSLSATATFYHFAWLKALIILRTGFLYFIVTTVVAFTLRETQCYMVQFTHELRYYVQHNMSVYNLVLTHVLESMVFVPIMVGMIFFLMEFYHSDRLLSFLVLSTVWLCESYRIISLRTIPSTQYFGKIAGCLFAAFHFYIFSFPHGFTYTALLTTVLFMIHTMLFFWYRYELPAVIFFRNNHSSTAINTTTYTNHDIPTAQQHQPREESTVAAQQHRPRTVSDDSSSNGRQVQQQQEQAQTIEIQRTGTSSPVRTVIFRTTTNDTSIDDESSTTSRTKDDGADIIDESDDNGNVDPPEVVRHRSRMTSQLNDGSDSHLAKINDNNEDNKRWTCEQRNVHENSSNDNIIEENSNIINTMTHTPSFISNISGGSASSNNIIHQVAGNGYISRHNSYQAIFQPGDEEDGSSSQSVVYHLGGEVVVPSPARLQHWKTLQQQQQYQQQSSPPTPLPPSSHQVASEAIYEHNPASHEEVKSTENILTAIPTTTSAINPIRRNGTDVSAVNGTAGPLTPIFDNRHHMHFAGSINNTDNFVNQRGRQIEDLQLRSQVSNVDNSEQVDSNNQQQHQMNSNNKNSDHLFLEDSDNDDNEEPDNEPSALQVILNASADTNDCY